MFLPAQRTPRKLRHPLGYLGVSGETVGLASRPGFCATQPKSNAACAINAGIVPLIVGVPALIKTQPDFVTAFAQANAAGALPQLLKTATLAYYVATWNPATVAAYYKALAPYYPKLAANGANGIAGQAAPMYINNGIISGVKELPPATIAANVAAAVKLGVAPNPLKDIVLVTYKSDVGGTFWTITGDLITAAQIAAIGAVAVFGAAAIASAASSAGAAATATAAEGSSVPLTVAATGAPEVSVGAVDLGVDTAVDTSVATAASTAGADTLETVTVTAAATPAASAAVPLAVASTPAVAIAAQSPTLDTSQPNPNYGDQSVTSPLAQAQQALSTAKTAASLVATASKLLASNSTPSQIVTGVPKVPAPMTGGNILTATSAGVPNYLWVALALAGVYFATA